VDTKSITWRWQIASGAIYALFVFAVPALGGASAFAWALTMLSFVVYVLLYADFFFHSPICSSAIASGR
jgi:hypothetical protein